ncbi:hypothetical protein BDR22DRAFT_882866 [Usnea florida]
MAWAVIRPRFWQRPIGENESMIKMTGEGGRNFVAHIDSKPLSQALCDGWKTLRFYHPSIATTAGKDILKKPASVILNLSHWRTDGIGAFHLLNAFFKAVLESLREETRDLPWGKESASLVPSIEEALGLPRTLSPMIERAAKQLIPKGTRGARFRFSQDITTELETACHRLGIHLEAAVHAAVTATAYSIADSASRHKHHSSTIRHSIRPHLPAPYNGEAGAAGLYTAGYLENAKQYETEYSRGATLDLLSSRRQYALTMKEILKNISPSDTPPSGLDFSYIPSAQALVRPIHANALESVELHDIRIGVDVLSRHLYVFMWVFSGRLQLRLLYNEAYYGENMVGSILALVEKHLVSNLLWSSGYCSKAAG